MGKSCSVIKVERQGTGLLVSLQSSPFKVTEPLEPRGKEFLTDLVSQDRGNHRRGVILAEEERDWGRDSVREGLGRGAAWGVNT